MVFPGKTGKESVHFVNFMLSACHAEPFLYCVGNVKAVKDDEIVIYEKIEDNKRIDVFDAAVFASIRYLIDTEKITNAAAWFGDDD